MPSLRTAATLLVLLAIGWAGWVINGWRIDAARASALADQLRDETLLRDEVERQRLELQKKLDAKKEVVAEKVKTITKTVIKHVPQNPDCDLPDDVAGVLQQFREGQLSNPSK